MSESRIELEERPQIWEPCGLPHQQVGLPYAPRQARGLSATSPHTQTWRDFCPGLAQGRWQGVHSEMSTGLEQGPSHLLCHLKMSALGLDTQAASIVEAVGGEWVSTVLVSLRRRSFQGSGLNRVPDVSKS